MISRKIAVVGVALLSMLMASADLANAQVRIPGNTPISPDRPLGTSPDAPLVTRRVPIEARPIIAKWAELGGRSGPLGSPISAETDAPHGGRMQSFAGGTIFWHPQTGAYAVWGAIGVRFAQMGGPGAYGYPTMDETRAADQRGLFQHFRQVHLTGTPEASIYSGPDQQARAVFGSIRTRYLQLGGADGALGYPISDEYDEDGGRRSDFEGGAIRWRADRGAEVGPALLQFRLLAFSEHESTDSGAQGASDEVYISALGIDPARFTLDASQNRTAVLIDGAAVGDVSDESVRGRWAAEPHVLMQFDLLQNIDLGGRYVVQQWPREYSVHLVIVEHDNADLSESFVEVKDRYGAVVVSAISAAVAIKVASVVGAALGSVVPGAGTIAGGVALAAVAAGAFAIIGEIDEGLANDVFQPRAVTIPVPSPSQLGPYLNRPQTLRVEEHGAVYDIVYDWHVVGAR